MIPIADKRSTRLPPDATKKFKARFRYWYTDWGIKFAWYPVQMVNGKWCWLRYVYYRWYVGNRYSNSNKTSMFGTAYGNEFDYLRDQ